MPRKASQAPLSEEVAAPGGVASVDRALSLLGAFTLDEPMLSLSDLSERTKQYKSTVLRLLASLEHARLVYHHADGRFGLGSAISRLHAVHAASFSIGEFVLPALRELVASTRESASFHVPQGNRDLCLYRIDSPQPLRDHGRPGDLLPLNRGFGGRVMAAMSGLRGVQHAKIRNELLLLAVDDVDPEVAGAAAPVFDAAAALAGVVVLTMPSTRLAASHGPLVQACAAALTAQFGGVFPAPPGARSVRRRAK